MKFLLDSQNVLDYLVEHKICNQKDKKIEVKLIAAKNFNLLLSLQDGRKFLVKQERQVSKDKTAEEFLHEWHNHQLFELFPELNSISLSLSKVLHFDADNSIIIFEYLSEYLDLSEFYLKENVFPIKIAAAVGRLLGTIHQATFERQEYKEFLAQRQKHSERNSAAVVASGLRNLKPEVFGMYPRDGIRFLTLYQRYDSLGKAITELSETFQSSCSTHNDLKLNNILLHEEWESILYQTEYTEHAVIRLIDWERGTWGDPASDLGTIVASYLQFWLNSLIVNKDIPIAQTLHLARTPLDLLQPSISTVVEAYLESFPEIIEHRPDFIRRVVQFAGLDLIQKIQAMIQHQKSFGNIGIFTLQVAKSLLCQPENSMSTIFGDSGKQLIHPTVSI
ncbi:MAG: aminoglycoside phosphotransferase family protein [Cyanobacteria bacterium P01_A01_bin.83]